MSSKHGRVTPRQQGRPAARDPDRAARRLLLSLMAALVLISAGIAALYAARRGQLAARPLDAQGLRVSGEGRADATRVLPAARFRDPRIQTAYRLAAQLPGTLNRLYCWCGCIERGMRSNLECFESEHGATCEACLAGAEIAWEMQQRGVTEPAAIQRVLDARYGQRT